MNTNAKPAKARVLVVDDEQAVLLTYRLILEQQGYDVAAAATSREAIDALARQNFDALLCDFSLEQQHTGFEVIEVARKRQPDIPAVLLTGYASQETAALAQQKKVGILYKPIEIEEFLKTTADMLRNPHEPAEAQ